MTSSYLYINQGYPIIDIFIQENAGRGLNFVAKVSFENGIYGSSCL